MAVANDTFTVKIKTMTGEVIPIEDMTMNVVVELLKLRLLRTYPDVSPHDMRLLYMTPRTDQGFIELVTGYLREYDGIIDFRDPRTELDMLIQHIEIDQHPAATLADLFEPENLVDVPKNTTVVHELSSDLNFKTIYISDDKKKGLQCTVKYIDVIGRVRLIILDVHIPNNPDVRLLHRREGGISPTLLDNYVQNGLVLVKEPPHVAVEEPAHGGRKKRTRRTRRKLHKKRTHRKRRNHKRVSP
jgi:hypothetical protein